MQNFFAHIRLSQTLTHIHLRSTKIIVICEYEMWRLSFTSSIMKRKLFSFVVSFLFYSYIYTAELRFNELLKFPISLKRQRNHAWELSM